jgi:hypothetical protein
MSFKYAVGEAVEYRPMGGKAGRYTVTRCMPEEDNAVDRRYRIKHAGESFERTVLECDLSATNIPLSNYAAVVPFRRIGGR